jgi:excisionase family DNA binding protein
MVLAEQITVREAARRAHRSAETIRRWIWSGRLPAEKHGNVYYVDIVHLERIMVMYEAGPSDSATSTGDLQAWLDDLDQWKASLSGSGGASAAELVIEDRHARR